MAVTAVLQPPPKHKRQLTVISTTLSAHLLSTSLATRLLVDSDVEHVFDIGTVLGRIRTVAVPVSIAFAHGKSLIYFQRRKSASNTSRPNGESVFSQHTRVVVVATLKLVNRIVAVSDKRVGQVAFAAAVAVSEIAFEKHT